MSRAEIALAALVVVMLAGVSLLSELAIQGLL